MKNTFFGLTTFAKSMQIQDQAYQLVARQGLPVVLGFEYYPVITLGKRADAGEELGNDFARLPAQGFEIVETDRGGQATLHSPGQLVIYPIIPLKKLKVSVREYVQALEEATIAWLQKHEISAERREDAGVFTARGKIAFIGIRVDRGISRHGISINISNDLNLFSEIRACGLKGRAVDSLLEQGVSLDLKEAFEEWNLYWTERLLRLVR